LSFCGWMYSLCTCYVFSIFLFFFVVSVVMHNVTLIRYGHVCVRTYILHTNTYVLLHVCAIYHIYSVYERAPTPVQ
jgi:hypothetical protein